MTENEFTADFWERFRNSNSQEITELKNGTKFLFVCYHGADRSRQASRTFNKSRRDLAAYLEGGIVKLLEYDSASVQNDSDERYYSKIRRSNVRVVLLLSEQELSIFSKNGTMSAIRRTLIGQNSDLEQIIYHNETHDRDIEDFLREYLNH